MTFRPETLVKTVTSVVPSGNTNYDIPVAELPAGKYDIGLFVTSSVTGTSTDIELFPIHVSGAANDEALGIVIAAATVTALKMTMAAGADERAAVVTFGSATAGVEFPVMLVNGLRVTVTKGGAATDEVLVVTIVATRRG